MYGIDRRTELPEAELTHPEGVRMTNGSISHEDCYRLMRARWITPQLPWESQLVRGPSRRKLSTGLAVELMSLPSVISFIASGRQEQFGETRPQPGPAAERPCLAGRDAAP